MAEFFTPWQLSVLSQGTVLVDRVVKFEFVSQTMYAWNGNSPLPVGGKTYLPMYGFGRIEGDGYAGGTVSEAITLTLSGLPDQELDFLGMALADTAEVEQQMLTLALLLFDVNWQPIGEPIPYFRGYMQPPKVARGSMQDAQGATQSISMSVENIFFSRARPPNGRCTDREQQARSPGDTLFGFVSSVVSKTMNYPDY
jgi:hypothetical protein